MHSKKSKSPLPNKPSLWKEEFGCDENRIIQIAREFALTLGPTDRVFLEGPMGVGKTTFARELLGGLGVIQPPEGSPTFAIAHEYFSPSGEVIHLDLYRLKSEEELEEAGVESYFWERQARVLVEWISIFPRFKTSILKTPPFNSRIWEVRLDFSESTDERVVRILCLFKPLS